jgi:rfaE bifunctional protein nucleotidyltransferase chain/domain/rfaE bifunctional protein kinase chain/domain
MTRRLVVIGDSMLDIDIDGTATRLSPEAPVPVVDGEQLGQRPGGAGLAAALAARHGADVTLVTAIGDDEHGRTLRRLLAGGGVDVVALPVSGSTACKTRVRAGGQNVLRLDQGTGTAGTFTLPAAMTELVGSAHAVVAADYGKGVCADDGVRALLTGIAEQVPVIWDPHPRGCAPTPGAALVTPNESEAQHFSRATDPTGPASVEELRSRWSARAVCVTLGPRGAVLATGADSCTHLAPAQSVVARPDTCGAGDRFAVAAAMALADGADVTAAVAHAVDAATRFVAAGGAGSMSTVTALPHVLTGTPTPPGIAPITDDLAEVARQLRRSTGKLVATGGCFDLLHTGHVRLLHRARQLGGALVVLLNSDASVRALKGPTRPVMAAQDRARVLAALACVDAVCIFDELSPETALATLRPDIWVKGGDYTAADLPEADVVRANGGDVVLLPTVPGYSSSQLIAAARS